MNGVATAPQSATDSGRAWRAMLTWSSGAVYTVVTLAVGLVTTPLIVQLLGDVRFGAFRAATDWFGYLQLTDLGVGAAFGVLLVRARVDGVTGTIGVIKAALSVLARLSILAIPLGVLLAWKLPQFIQGGSALATELRWAGLVSTAALLLSPLLVFRSYLDANQRGYLVNAALIGQSLTVTGLSLLLAWRGWGLVGQSIAVVAGTAAFIALVTTWSVRSLTSARTREAGDGQSSRPTARETWALSWPLAIAAAGNRLNLMTDTVVVGGLLGVSAVASLFLSQRVVLLAASQVNALAGSSWAGLAELRQTGKLEQFEQRLCELTRLVLGAGLTLVGSVAAFTSDFVTLWVGARFYGGDLLCVFTLVSAVVFAFLLPYSWAVDMAGDTRHRLVVSSLGSALNLALSIFFVKRFGLPGVALGTVVALLVTDAWYCPWLVSRRYGIRGRAIFAAVLRGLAVGVPWLIFVWIVAHRLPPVQGWADFAIRTGLVGAAAAVYAWLRALTDADRGAWTRRLRAMRA